MLFAGAAIVSSHAFVGCSGAGDGDDAAARNGTDGSASGEAAASGDAPTIAIVSPLAGSDESRRLLRFAAKDGTGLRSITYSLNGGPEAPVEFDGEPVESTMGVAVPFVAGPNDLAVTVTNLAGVSTRATVAFRYGGSTGGGSAHSAAIAKGAVLVWGRNNFGQLGLGGDVGDAFSRSAPVALASFGAAPPVAVSLSQNHTFVIEADKTLWAFGNNDGGHLCSGSEASPSTPTATLVSDATYVASGYSHAFVVHDDGSISGCGANSAGELGLASDLVTSPTKVPGLPKDVVKIVGGSGTSAALTASGRLYLWGRNDSGQLATGSADDGRHETPALSTKLFDVVDVAAGRAHFLALRADGKVFAWGAGETGQLGYGASTDPETMDRYEPQAVLEDKGDGSPRELSGVASVFANGNSSYALLANGQYWAWGQNFSGQLAIGVTSSEELLARRAGLYAMEGTTPRYLDEIVQVRGLGVGLLHTIAMMRDESVYAWGWNTRGSLGIASLANNWAQTQPLSVPIP